MVKIEMNTAYSNPEDCEVQVETDISDFIGDDIVEQAAIEIKGAMFFLMLNEYISLVKKTKRSPEDVALTMCNIIGCDPDEFGEFIRTITAK